MVEVSDASTLLAQARIAVIQAGVELEMAHARLERVLGDEVPLDAEVRP
jgi:outer membrane protein TolC